MSVFITHRRFSLILFFALLFIFDSRLALAETISYPSDGSSLSNVNWSSNVLAPSGSASGKSASLSGNSITLEAGSKVNYLYGAINNQDANPAEHNQIFIYGEVENVLYGGISVYSSDSPTSSNDSSVIINDGRVGMVYGGNAGNGIGAATAANNTVTLNGGLASQLVGGDAGSIIATASHNTVIATGGTVTGITVGGQAVNNYGAHDDSVITATDNRVIVNGGTFKSHLYAGSALDGNDGLATASNNILEISGAPSFSGNVRLFGGSTFRDKGISIGNTLNLHSIISVWGIESFQIMNLYLPAALTTDGVLLTASGNVNLDYNMKVQVTLEGATPKLGDTFVLIRAGKLIGAINQASKTGTLGGLDYKLEIDGNDLLLKFVSVAAIPAVTVGADVAFDPAIEGGTLPQLTLTCAPEATSNVANAWTVEEGAACTLSVAGGTPPEGYSFNGVTFSDASIVVDPASGAFTVPKGSIANINATVALKADPVAPPAPPPVAPPVTPPETSPVEPPIEWPVAPPVEYPVEPPETPPAEQPATPTNAIPTLDPKALLMLAAVTLLIGGLTLGGKKERQQRRLQND